MIFNLNSYQQLLTRITSHGFKFVAKPTFGAGEILLRHDIDFSLKASMPMARLENQAGIRATYFVMISNDFYSLLNLESKNQLLELIELGHSIGLHFDTSAYISESLPSSLKSEMQLLQNVSGKEVSSYSEHQPTLNGINRIAIPELTNMYSPEIMSQYKYLSDSCMSPREEWEESFIKEKRVQLLVHPEYWTLACSDISDFGEKFRTIISKEKVDTIDNAIKIMQSTLLNRNKLDKKVLNAFADLDANDSNEKN